MKLAIRNAREDDASQLIALLAQMGYQMALEKMKSRIAAFNTKNHQLLVVEHKDLLIGVIAFGLYEQFRIPSKCCHIDTLVIHKDHQGKGIGKQLIRSAEKYALEQGATAIELITANYRKKSGTHAFYESLGYKDHITLDYAYFAKENL